MYDRYGSLPFAAPLSAVDRVDVVGAEPGTALQLSAEKTIDVEDPYMCGHFPGFPIYPGVFVAETVLQAVARAGRGGPRPTIATVRHLRLLAPLLAGDTLSCSVSVKPRESPEMHAVVADIRRGDGRAAARLDCVIRFSGHDPSTR